jgi:hypothetical protein
LQLRPPRERERGREWHRARRAREKRHSASRKRESKRETARATHSQAETDRGREGERARESERERERERGRERGRVGTFMVSSRIRVKKPCSSDPLKYWRISDQSGGLSYLPRFGFNFPASTYRFGVRVI